MKKSNRHLPGRGHVFLVLMLVFASIVPGAVHAAAMGGSAAVNSTPHHVDEGSSIDHSVMNHHQAGATHAGAVQDPMHTDHGNTTDQCCPISCSSALCSVEPLREAVFIPDSFVITPLPGFVVTAMALPERPPRA
ncbi:MAG: hypothetical protein COA37_17640 [Hoeflea sp.]|uniref:hypothetical protein n=1 Tax=Hoeflea sp. TaxID=1940281 RepID=UPI000C0CC111|nr:hypothetical protein [Hoeflea sp.]PHR19254.1 MAG: hypothetical protein COA37_17640 [Hoeflea sp.]